MTIWKYQLKITDQNVLVIPKGAKLLSVVVQRHVLCLWAIVEPDREKEKRVIEILGTGNHVSERDVGRRFIGTVVMGSFDWHVFERLDERQEVKQ